MDFTVVVSYLLTMNRVFLNDILSEWSQFIIIYTISTLVLEVVIQESFIEKLFWKNFQNSGGNICDGLLFGEAGGLCLQLD